MEKLFVDNYSLLFRIARKRFGNEQDAKDVLQSIFVSFCSRRQNISVLPAVKLGYFIRCIDLQYSHQIRQIKSHNLVYDIVDQLVAPTIDPIFQQLKNLEALINKLPPAQKTAALAWGNPLKKNKHTHQNNRKIALAKLRKQKELI